MLKFTVYVVAFVLFSFLQNGLVLADSHLTWAGWMVQLVGAFAVAKGAETLYYKWSGEEEFDDAVKFGKGGNATVHGTGIAIGGNSYPTKK